MIVKKNAMRLFTIHVFAMKAIQGLCHPEGGTTEGSRSFANAYKDDRIIFCLFWCCEAAQGSDTSKKGAVFPRSLKTIPP